MQNFKINVASVTEGNIRKRFTLDKSGKLTKDKSRKMSISEGTFEVIELDSVEGLAAMLSDFPDNAALIAGVPKNGATTQAFTTKEKRSDGTIARCLEDLEYPEQFALLIDYDGKPVSDPRRIWQNFLGLLGLMDEVENVAWVAIPSSSTHIHDTSGKEVVPGGRWHIYVIARGDVSNLRSFAKSRGVDAMFDLSPWQAAAVHYEASPILPKGFSQRKPDPVISDGKVWDLDSLPKAPTPPPREPIPPSVDLKDADRFQTKEIIRFLDLINFEPGSGTYPIYRDIINALANLIGEEEAGDVGRRIAPERPKQLPYDIARTAPRLEGAIATLVDRAKTLGYTPSKECKRLLAQALKPGTKLDESKIKRLELISQRFQESGDIGQRDKEIEALAEDAGLSVEEVKAESDPVGDMIHERIRNLALDGVSGSSLTIALQEISDRSKSNWPLSSLRKLFDEVSAEVEREQRRDDTKSELEALQATKSGGLDLHRILPDGLAAAIVRRALSLNIRPENLMMALLAGLSSQHNPQTRLRINQGFDIPPAIWFGLIGSTGSLKTPILNMMVNSPLGRIEAENRKRYDTAMAQWTADAKQQGDDCSDPEPVREKTITTDATHEGLLHQLMLQSRGMVVFHDELESLHASIRKSDRRGDVLQFFNAGGVHKLLKGKGSGSDRYTDIESPLVVYVGGVQPEILNKYIGNGDADGFWARFLLGYQPEGQIPLHIDTEAPEGLDPDDDPNTLEGMLLRLYKSARRIGANPAIMRVSPEAAARYVAFNDEMESLKLHPSTSRTMSAVIAKMRGYVGRVAMAIRLLWDADGGADSLTPIIDEGSMMAAIAVTRLHINNTQLIHAESAAGGLSSLPWKLQKILEFSNGDPVGASDVIRSVGGFRKTQAMEVKTLFDELVKMEMGEMVGSGRTAKFKSYPSSIPTPGVVEEQNQIHSNSHQIHTKFTTAVKTGNPCQTRDIDDIDKSNSQIHKFTTHQFSETQSPNGEEAANSVCEFGEFGEFAPKPIQGNESKFTEVVNLDVNLVNLDSPPPNSPQPASTPARPHEEAPRQKNIQSTVAHLLKAIAEESRQKVNGVWILWGQYWDDAVAQLTKDQRVALERLR